MYQRGKFRMLWEHRGRASKLGRSLGSSGKDRYRHSHLRLRTSRQVRVIQVKGRRKRSNPGEGDDSGKARWARKSRGPPEPSHAVWRERGACNGWSGD